VAKKKQSHREIFRYFETWIYLPHKGIAPASDAALMLLHSILKPYAVAEQAAADAKKAQEQARDAERAEAIRKQMQPAHIHEFLGAKCRVCGVSKNDWHWVGALDSSVSEGMGANDPNPIDADNVAQATI
jgi:hypothetical protein